MTNDNREEIGAARTQRFHELFKITRSWGKALDILHAEALRENTMARYIGHGQVRKAGAIQRWLTRHDIALVNGSKEDCERVGKLYHAAMAKDIEDAYADDALIEQAARKLNVPLTQYEDSSDLLTREEMRDLW